MHINTLFGWIQSIWALEGTIPLHKSVFMRIVPSGTVDMLLNLGSPVTLGFPFQYRMMTDSLYLVGPMHHPFLIAFQENVDLFGIRFKHGGGKPILKFYPRKISSLINDYNYPTSTYRPYNLNTRIQNIEAVFSDLITKKDAPDPELQQLISLIEKEPGDFNVHNMHRYLGVSERQLQRVTHRQLNLTPSTLLRLIRFRQSLRYLRHQPSIRWTDLCHCCGYYDQSHFIKEFRKFSGLTPTAYIREDVENNFVNFYIRHDNYQRYPNLISAIG